MLLRSFLLFIAPAIVHAQAPPTGTTVNIKDYKGNVLDLAFASAADLAPVQTLNHKSLEVAQAWVIEPAGTQFTVLNPFASTFLSFTTVANGVKPTSAQVCGHPTVNTAWTIAASKLGGFNIIEPKSQLAVTSWALSTSSVVGLTTPLTLQAFDPNSAQQVFTFAQWS